MALSITLEGEFGDKLGTVLDSENLLHRLLPRQENAEYALLHYIDWYGNTIFNRMQMKSLISDLQKLSGKTKEQQPLILLNSILTLCNRCLNEVHLYIKFRGD